MTFKSAGNAQGKGGVPIAATWTAALSDAALAEEPPTCRGSGQAPFAVPYNDDACKHV